MLLDIRFYLALLFIVRMYGIMDAPLESSHSWRQCITNMTARNFSESGLDIMHPRVDLGGNETGILGSEFPFLNALIYVMNSIFGFQHWYGRLINLCMSTIGIYYFYLLIKNCITQKVAFYSSLLLSLSIWLTFSRKIMPDTFSVSLVIIGLYFAYNYLKKGHWKSLLLYFLFSTVGMLCKIPALSIFSVIACIFFIQQIHLKRKLYFIIISGICVSIVLAWYFLWIPHLISTYKYQLYIPKGLLEGIQELQPYFGKLLKRFYFDAFHSFLAFGCFVVGIVFLVKNKQFLILKSFGIITVVFILFIIKTGNVFPLHSYYIIPFVPVMAVVAGYFLAQLPTKIQYTLMAIIAIESIANQQHDFKINDKKLSYLGLEEKVDQHIPKNALIVTSGGRAPNNMYYAHRKGWVAYNYDLERKEYTDSLAKSGANYLLIRKSDIEYKNKGYDLTYEDDYFSFYDLTSPIK